MSSPPFLAARARFSHARVLIVGVGGLGCPAAQLLGAAGIGQVTLVDPDRMSLSNLHRQLLFDEQDLDKAKAVVAAKKLSGLFAATRFVPLPVTIDESNAPSLIAAHDWVVDATDGWDTKLWLHDLALYHERPVSHAGAMGWQGQALTALPNIPGCLRCVAHFPDAEEDASCQQAGIIPGVVQLLGARLAAEVVAGLTGHEEALLVRKVLHVDAYRMRIRVVPFAPDPNCRVCGVGARLAPARPAESV
ncbi:Molybdopterin-synthase adenylyltransferase [bacterium HR30]|nr:Molybdopterin-synthase adenylyltransferase [bacterium HR30]